MSILARCAQWRLGTSYSSLASTMSGLALASLVFPGIAVAQDMDLSGAFGRLQQAQQQLRFKGTLIYRSGDQMEVFQIAPGVLRSDQSLKLLQLAPNLIQLEAAGMPSQLPRMQWQGPANPDAAQRFEQLRASYAISAEATATIDGRPALPMRFEPRDGWRFAQTLWMDEATGLLLKSELRDQGRVLEQSMLLHVELMEAQAAPITIAPLASARTLEGMPDGFRVLRHAAQGESEHWLVGDGLCSVSVFIEPVQGQGQSGESRRGGMLSIAEIRQDRQLVAVGAVPVQTLKRLLSGVSLTP